MADQILSLELGKYRIELEEAGASSSHEYFFYTLYRGKQKLFGRRAEIVKTKEGDWHKEGNKIGISRYIRHKNPYTACLAAFDAATINPDEVGWDTDEYTKAELKWCRSDECEQLAYLISTLENGYWDMQIERSHISVKGNACACDDPNCKADELANDHDNEYSWFDVILALTEDDQSWGDALGACSYRDQNDWECSEEYANMYLVVINQVATGYGY